MRIEIGSVNTVIYKEDSNKTAGRLSFGYFSLAKQRKVTGVLSPTLNRKKMYLAHQKVY